MSMCITNAKTNVNVHTYNARRASIKEHTCTHVWNRHISYIAHKQQYETYIDIFTHKQYETRIDASTHTHTHTSSCRKRTPYTVLRMMWVGLIDSMVN